MNHSSYRGLMSTLLFAGPSVSWTSCGTKWFGGAGDTTCIKYIAFQTVVCTQLTVRGWHGDSSLGSCHSQLSHCDFCGVEGKKRVSIVGQQAAPNFELILPEFELWTLPYICLVYNRNLRLTSTLKETWATSSKPSPWRGTNLTAKFRSWASQELQ